MNNIQSFCKNEKNIQKLHEAIRKEECNPDCPAYKFCCHDAKLKNPKYDDCKESFIAWALKEHKNHKRV